MSVAAAASASMNFGYYYFSQGQISKHYVEKTYISPPKTMSFSSIEDRINAFKANRLLCENNLFPNEVLTAYKGKARGYHGGIEEGVNTMGELFNHRVVLFTLPSTVKLADQIKLITDSADKIQNLNIDTIICIGSNHVEDVVPLLKGRNNIEYWSDSEGNLTDKLGEGFNNTDEKRYALNRTVRVINNMKEEWYQKEEDPSDNKLTHPDAVITYLQSSYKAKPPVKTWPDLPL